MSPTVGSAKLTPSNRIVRFRLNVGLDGPRPDTAALKRELSKRYPIQRIQLTAKHPPEPDGTLMVVIAVYLLKEVFGPTLRQIVKDAYAFVKKQIAKKGGKRVAIPHAGFIHNGTARADQKAKRIVSLLAEYGNALDCVLPRLTGVLGEGIVCAELKKRGVPASLCLGQKRAIDLVTESGLRLQVKTAQKPSFVTGLAQKNFYRGHEPDIWALVLIAGVRPRFFILTHREICKLQKAVNNKYMRRYLLRNGRPFEGRGVDRLPLAKVEKYEDKWSKVK